MKRSLVAVTATLAAVALAGFVVSPAFGGPSFLTLTRAKKVFVTKRSARKYLTKTEAAASYLSQEGAASTYLGKAEAGSTYLGKGAAESTYLGKSAAESTYLSRSDAQRDYVGKAEADAKYLPASARTTIAVSPANWVVSSGPGSVSYIPNTTMLSGSGEPNFLAGTSVPSELQGRPVKLTGIELCAEVPFPAEITEVIVVLGNEAAVTDETAHGSGCFAEELPTPTAIGLNTVQVLLRAVFNGETIQLKGLSINLTD